jgi:hypothetical protein
MQRANGITLPFVGASVQSMDGKWRSQPRPSVPFHTGLMRVLIDPASGITMNEFIQPPGDEADPTPGDRHPDFSLAMATSMRARSSCALLPVLREWAHRRPGEYPRPELRSGSDHALRAQPPERFESAARALSRLPR